MSRVGTKLTKLHAMIHLVSSIKKYGVPNNYFGGILESLLKTFVKQPSKRTRKMHGDAFLLDLSNRWSECQMVQQFVEMNPVNLYTIQVDQKKVSQLMTAMKKIMNIIHLFLEYQNLE